MKIGYARVSTEDQNLDRQCTALTAAGCTTIFKEKVSGRKASRPELDAMLQHLREGDEVIVVSIDRIGRSVINLIKLITDLHDRGITFQSLNEGFAVNDTAMGNFFLQICGAFAELEANMISERTKAGLEEARRRGRVGGRPKGLSKTSKDKAIILLSLWDRGWTVSQIMKHLNIGSTTTFYKWKEWATKDIDKAQKNGKSANKL